MSLDRLLAFWCFHPGQTTQMLSAWISLWIRGNWLSFKISTPSSHRVPQQTLLCCCKMIFCSEISDLLFCHRLLWPGAPWGRTLLLLVTVPAFTLEQWMLSIPRPYCGLLYMLPAPHECLVCELACGARCLLLLMCDVSTIAAGALKVLEQARSRVARTINNSLAVG